MKLWKFIAIMALTTEAQETHERKRKPKRKPKVDTTSSTSTTMTTTTLTSTTFTTLSAISDLARDIQGTWDDGVGNTITISRNPDNSFIVLIRDSTNTITGFDTITITDEANKLLNFGSLGPAVFDTTNSRLTFQNTNVNWNKGTSAATTAATTTPPDVTGVVTVASAATTASTATVATVATTDSTAATGAIVSAAAPAAATTASTAAATGSMAASVAAADVYGAGSVTDAYGYVVAATTQSTAAAAVVTQAPSATGVVQGDPHIRIQAPGEQPVCYDIEAEAMDYVSLIEDERLGLEINGWIEHVKAGKNRLAKIGIQTKSGIQVSVDDQIVEIGTDGIVEDSYTFEDYTKIVLDDISLEILTPYEGVHHNTLMVEIDSGAQFMISSKAYKDSMRMEILKDFGLSADVGGVFGHAIRPKEYTMEGSTLIVEGRHIPNLAFDLDRSCYYISEWDVPAFLGHGEMDYKVDGLFSAVPWIRAKFHGLGEPDH